MATVGAFQDALEDNPKPGLSNAHAQEEEVILSGNEAEDDSDDEDFVYPDQEEDNVEETHEEFIYTPSSPVLELPTQSVVEPAASTSATPPSFEQEPVLPIDQHAIPVLDTASSFERDPTLEPPGIVIATPARPTPAQLEALNAAASSGDLSLLKQLFLNTLEVESIEAFNLVNDASPRTGFTTLHVAASRGYLDIVKWLIEDCAAMPDLEDREGETALHKAALNGHIMVVQYLTPHKSDVHARDADGWTALHNACSKGYLDIVRYLCEGGGAIARSDGTSGIDARSKDGWTPLMNAASKGHLPVVRYLLNKQKADPLVRNNWGETAYDVAAAVFEVWICEILQQAEAVKWRNTTVAYNPLSVHTTVPLVLYENQRLDVRLKTVAVSGGRPKFSASGLGRHGRRSPFELRLPSPDEETNATTVPAWRSGVQLPLRSNWCILPNPGSNDPIAYDSTDRSHFWLSDWTLDVTPPGVDAEEGWQYAHSFSDPDDQWTADKPPQLERILSGIGLMASGLGGRGSSSSSTRSPQTWVRRRRWVRIMRRRLDISPMPFLESDGAMYFFGATGEAIPHMDEHPSDIAEAEGQELGSMPPSMLASARDYVAKARYLVGRQPNENDSGPPTPIEARRAIAKLERATTELRQGILADDNIERKRQAEVLLNAYSRELERRRLSAGAQGLLISGPDDQVDSDDDESDDEFRYPGAEASRPASRSSGLNDSRVLGQRLPPDLTPQLSQAPEFRVPTHEAPQKVLGPRWTSPTPQLVHAQWERDELVSNCRECQRRFNFITRRHCRRCGRIFCDRCSSYRALLDPSDIVHDPLSPHPTASSSSQRVCLSCHDEVNATIPPRLQGTRVNAMERIIVEEARLTVPGHLNRRQTGSQLSDLAECPVCNRNLDQLGTIDEQEVHVKTCLEGGSGTVNSVAKYLVYRLPAKSALLGVECVICLEEFVEGSEVARLSCFCSFHNGCLSSWLQRGKNCPVHAR